MTTVPIDLSGWDVTRLSGGSEVRMLAIPNGTVLAGSTFLIANSDEDNSQLAVMPDLVTSEVPLANNQLQVRLYDASFDSDGTLIDTADDGTGAPAAGENPGTLGRKSMVRNNPPDSGSEPSSWHTADRAFGWDAGAAELVTPGHEILCLLNCPSSQQHSSRRVYCFSGKPNPKPTIWDSGSIAAINVMGLMFALIPSWSAGRAPPEHHTPMNLQIRM